MKEHNLDKLPKWARQEIETLKSNIAHYKGVAKEIKGDKKTNTYISDHINNPIPLPNDARIIFVTNPERSIETEQMQVRVIGDSIEIYCNEQLKIRLQSSNICLIEQDAYRG